MGCGATVSREVDASVQKPHQQSTAEPLPAKQPMQSVPENDVKPSPKMNARKSFHAENIGGAAAHHVAVIGAGFVGTAIAFRLLSQDLGFGKVTLTDVNTTKLEGEVLDLADCGGAIESATPAQAGQADVIVITAGRGQREGETRLDLIKSNAGILKSVIKGMMPIKPTAIMIIVSNPCDVLTFVAQQVSGLPREHVLGSGTVLDTNRLRIAISDQIGVHHSCIAINVLGEHGDSQFPAISCAHISNIPLLAFPGMENVDVQKLASESVKKAYAIISRKGYTAFGVGASTVKIVESILKDRREVLTVSVRIPNTRACLSVPCIVGADGIERILDVTPHLSADENEKLNKSIKTMEGMIDSLE